MSGEKAVNWVKICSLMSLLSELFRTKEFKDFKIFYTILMGKIENFLTLQYYAIIRYVNVRTGMILFQSAMTHLYNVARQNRGCLEMLEPTKGRSGNGRMARKTAGEHRQKETVLGERWRGQTFIRDTSTRDTNTKIQIYKYKIQQDKKNKDIYEI